MARITYSKPTASGKRTGWAVAVTGLDRTQKFRKALIGDYLPEGRQIDLPEGQLVIEIVPCGSVKNGYEGVRFYRATGPDLVHITWSDEELWDWRADHLDVLDRIEELLATETHDDQQLQATDQISKLYNEMCKQIESLRHTVCTDAMDMLHTAAFTVEDAMNLQWSFDLQKDQKE